MDDNRQPHFPSTRYAAEEPNGLLAAGGKIVPSWLDRAYRQGIFPWNNPDEIRLWWSPAPRAIITPERFHVPRSVKKALRRSLPLITCNQAFTDVIKACAAPRPYAQDTWIDEEILDGYQRMHRAGRAISVELWDKDGKLAAGFYGLIIGTALFGESMFSRIDNGSKMAFAVAANALFQQGYQLIDCQMQTQHLAQFGAQNVSRANFESLLLQATDHPPLDPLPSVLCAI